MPLEFLPLGFFGILIIGIFAPYWLKTKDLKKISSKDLPPDGNWAKLSRGNIYYRWHYPEQKMVKPLSWSMVFPLLALFGMDF